MSYSALIAILALAAVAPCLGCSTYTLAPVTAADAKSDFPEGATYRVLPPNAVLIRSFSTAAVGIGEPAVELDRQSYHTGRDVIHSVPAGTPVKIERYVCFEQHGLYDCGSNGWKFAIASIADGEFRGTTVLIQLQQLKTHDPEDLLLQPR